MNARRACGLVRDWSRQWRGGTDRATDCPELLPQPRLLPTAAWPPRSHSRGHTRTLTRAGMSAPRPRSAICAQRFPGSVLDFQHILTRESPPPLPSPPAADKRRRFAPKLHINSGCWPAQTRPNSPKSPHNKKNKRQIYLLSRRLPLPAPPS